MRPRISILIGSGFSIPEGIPGVRCLNNRLSRIDEGEIIIHSDQSAFFLNAETDNNRWMMEDERFLVQEFLEFYNNEVLKESDEFHYEDFYDYYYGYLVNQENQESIENFCNIFDNKHNISDDNPRNCHNRISDFNRTFNQLLASLLHKRKYFEDVTTLDYEQYDSFIVFLREILKTHDVKIHSLNHDLFFDWLGSHHSALCSHFSDGYQLEGSEFYGVVNINISDASGSNIDKKYHVKLRKWTNNFNTSISFYKLHGSISDVIVRTRDGINFRIKNDYAVSRIQRELRDPHNGEIIFENLWDEPVPEFLSGTTSKIRSYSGEEYYNILFNHFENNLRTSELLLVIGYGFQDSGINKYLVNNFLSKGKRMVVIDPSKPKTHLIDKYNATYISKGVTEMTSLEYLNLVAFSDKLLM